MNNSSDIRLMIGKAEEDFGWSTIETKITLSDLAKKIGNGTHAKSMIQMILFYKIESLNQTIIGQKNQEDPDTDILKGFRELKDAYEKFALMSKELPH